MTRVLVLGDLPCSQQTLPLINVAFALKRVSANHFKGFILLWCTTLSLAYLKLHSCISYSKSVALNLLEGLFLGHTTYKKKEEPTTLVSTVKLQSLPSKKEPNTRTKF